MVRVRFLVVVGAVGFIAGCGGSAPSTQPSSSPSSLSISVAQTVLPVGESAQLRALVTYSNGSVVDAAADTSWKSSDDTICDVSSTGIVTALTPGRATITATVSSLSALIELQAEKRSTGVSIRGEVLDFSTQTGVSGTVVQFVAASHVAVANAVTDANGFYVVSVPTVDSFSVSVDNAHVGTVRVTWSAFRGDVLVNGGACVSRYGRLTDARTLRPVSGGTVSVGGGTTVSGPDGWYRVDLGCPATGKIGFNTTFLYVTHPDYAPRQWVVGRGVQGVERLDLALERQ